MTHEDTSEGRLLLFCSSRSYSSTPLGELLRSSPCFHQLRQQLNRKCGFLVTGTKCPEPNILFRGDYSLFPPSTGKTIILQFGLCGFVVFVVLFLRAALMSSALTERRVNRQGQLMRNACCVRA